MIWKTKSASKMGLREHPTCAFLHLSGTLLQRATRRTRTAAKHRHVTGNDSMDSIGTMNQDESWILSAAISGVDATEFFSPVRVAAVAAKFGLSPGKSFDLRNGWVSARIHTR